MQNTAERTEQSTSSLVHLIKPTLWLAAHTSNTLLQVHNEFTANHSKPLSQASQPALETYSAAVWRYRPQGAAEQQLAQNKRSGLVLPAK